MDPEVEAQAGDQGEFSNTFTHLLVVLVDVPVGELLPTQLALVGLVLAVDDLVSRHLVEAFEGAAAHLTGVRTLL